MKNEKLKDFTLGILIAFTIAILIISLVLTIAGGETAIPTALVWESLVLSILCSLINLVYRLDKLSFLWRSVIGYIFTSTVIMACSFIFDWYTFGGCNFKTPIASFLFFAVVSLFYLLTWIIIWHINKMKKMKLNDKLREYKQKQ